MALGRDAAVRGAVFRESPGFDPSLKCDDIELIRRLSKIGRFAIVEEPVFLSDRRYGEDGVRTMVLPAPMALFFALGHHEWANSTDYGVGEHE